MKMNQAIKYLLGSGLVAGTFSFCDPTDEDCDCMGDVALITGLLKNKPTDFGCTSNDVRVAATQIISVDGQTDGPFTCIDGDIIEVQLKVQFENGASARRSDIGLWLSEDGGNAETGNCKHNSFSTDDLASADVLVDSCGDLAPGQQVPFILLDAFTLPCTDEGIVQGKVNVGSCIGWKIPGADADCDAVAESFGGNYAAATLPGTKSKCRCETLVLDIAILSPPILRITIVCGAPVLTTTSGFTVAQNYAGQLCNVGGSNAENVQVTVTDGNGVPSTALSPPQNISPGGCVSFQVVGVVTTSTAGSACTATFYSSAMATGSFMGNTITSNTGMASCAVCNCGAGRK